MSLVDRFAGAVRLASTPKVPASVAEIETKIASAKERIVQLQNAYARSALSWVDSGDATERDRLAAELAAARVDLVSLKAALTMANARDNQIERERMAGLNARKLHSMTMHLRTMEKAANELTAALERVADARRKMHAAAVKARLSAPGGMPKGSLTEPSTIDVLIQHEQHRLSYEPATAKGKGDPGLPGAKPPSLLQKDEPGKLEPLSDQLRRSHDWAISVIRGLISPDHTPQVVAQVVADTAQLAAVNETVSPERMEFDPKDLKPGTYNAASVPVPRVKLSVGE
jgi:hypothetical protein